MVKIIEEKQPAVNFHHASAGAAKKGPSWVLILIAVAIIAVALVYVIFLKQPNITTQTLKVQYVMELSDGTIIGNGTTEIPSGALASALGLSSQNLDSVAGNMAIGGEKEIKLAASDAFGAYDPQKIEIINRTSELRRKEEMNRTFSTTTATFTGVFSEEPVLNKTYSSQNSPWGYKVLEVNNATGAVKLSQEAVAGTIFPLSELLNMKITEVTAEKIKTELQADDQTMEVPSGNLTIKVSPDYIYFTLTPPVGERIEIGGGTAKVLSYNETSIVLDYNENYAGENVTVKLKLLDKKTISSAGYSVKDIAGAPTLDVFVMSYCPYGTQIEKAALPVWKLLGDKANIKVRFVSYAMHGEKEEQENKIQLCLREETEKFWSYLECFLEAGDSAGCLNKVNADSNKLNSCMETKAEAYWQADKDLNTKYGVQGSPTIVLDGEVAQIARNPEAIKQAVCNAFSSKPSACSQALSSENASPGFGYTTTSSSSSSAGCGSA